MMSEPIEHELAQFRASVRRFFAERVAPRMAEWEERGLVDREIWKEAGDLGMLCTSVPAEYGGLGLDFRFGAIVLEEQALAGLTAPAFGVHSDVVAPYLTYYGSPALRDRWLPRLTAGTAIAALGMSEPSCGSDAKALKTTARRDGDHFVVNGQKTFISNGEMADIVVLAARTNDTPGARGISLILVETDTPGFRRGKPLNKVGLRAQDTAELFFDDMRVPVSNLIGEEGKGFEYLMSQLAKERMMIAVTAVAAAEAAVDWAVEYAADRRAFGQAVKDFQNTRFKLAEAATEVEIGRTFMESCIAELIAGKLSPERAAMAKLWTSEMQGRVIDITLQVFGGYGYILDYPIARAYLDCRAQRLYGGTSEIMKEIIGRTLWPDDRAGRAAPKAA